MSFPNFPDELSEFCWTFLICHPKIGEDLFFSFFGTFRILLNFPNFFRIFRMSFPNFWLLSEFSSTFRILVFFPNFGRKWTRNRVPRFPLFSNSASHMFDCQEIMMRDIHITTETKKLLVIYFIIQFYVVMDILGPNVIRPNVSSERIANFYHLFFEATS